MAPRTCPLPRARGAALAALLVVTASTQAVHADEPVPPTRAIDPDSAPRPAARGTLALVGLTAGLGAYGLAYGMGALYPEAPASSSLAIPVAGPWMSLARTGCGPREPGCGTFTLVFRSAVTGVSGVIQAGAVLLLVEAALLPTREGAVKPRAVSGTIRAVPWAAPGERGGAAGIAAVGRF